MVQVNKVAYMHEEQELPLDVTGKNLAKAMVSEANMEAAIKKAAELDKAELHPTTTTTTTAQG